MFHCIRTYLLRPSKEQLLLLVHAAYDRGLTKGYDLAWQMRQIESYNRLGILNSEIEKELDEILSRRRKGLTMSPELEKELDELLEKPKH